MFTSIGIPPYFKYLSNLSYLSSSFLNGYVAINSLNEKGYILIVNTLPASKVVNSLDKR